MKRFSSWFGWDCGFSGWLGWVSSWFGELYNLFSFQVGSAGFLVFRLLSSWLGLLCVV